MSIAERHRDAVRGLLALIPSEGLESGGQTAERFNDLCCLFPERMAIFSTPEACREHWVAWEPPANEYVFTDTVVLQLAALMSKWLGPAGRDRINAVLWDHRIWWQLNDLAPMSEWGVRMMIREPPEKQSPVSVAMWLVLVVGFLVWMFCVVH